MTEEDPDMEKLIQNTNYENLDIITANLNLLKANLEASMDLTRVQQTRLKKAVERVKEDYDFCVIDNAPDINISVINALAAADDVLIPIEIDDNTMEGMGQDGPERLSEQRQAARCPQEHGEEARAEESREAR